jgi:hypothetical protein
MAQPPNPPRPGIRRRITIIEELEPGPEAAGPSAQSRTEPSTTTVPLCPWHRPPRAMAPLGASRSADGGGLVLYACSDPTCRYREGWGPDPRSGRPRRLIRGFDQGRR